MCTKTLANIARDACPNRPGLTSVVSLAYADELTSIGAATNHAVAAITPVATKGFFKINCSRKGSEQGSVPGEEGGYTTTAKYFVPRQEAAKSGILTGLNGTEALIAVTHDQNSEDQILGALDHPVRVKVSATKTPRNGYELEIMWEEHADLPLHFTGTLTYV